MSVCLNVRIMYTCVYACVYLRAYVMRVGSTILFVYMCMPAHRGRLIFTREESHRQQSVNNDKRQKSTKSDNDKSASVRHLAQAQQLAKRCKLQAGWSGAGTKFSPGRTFGSPELNCPA